MVIKEDSIQINKSEYISLFLIKEDEQNLFIVFAIEWFKTIRGRIHTSHGSMKFQEYFDNKKSALDFYTKTLEAWK